jgi:hypothetical protein
VLQRCFCLFARTYSDEEDLPQCLRCPGDKNYTIVKAPSPPALLTVCSGRRGRSAVLRSTAVIFYWDYGTGFSGVSHVRLRRKSRG